MTTFISYSRDNSDFALRLAKNLRVAGFDIWLDQLDIRTGTRWDDEVEKALEKSNIFLIVLTPESIQSQNVKDEIGYAIDAGKYILPIILKRCNIPFRLRRFQYVDFSNKPYDESFAEIKHLLTNTNELARVDDDKQGDVQIEKPVLKSESEKASRENKPVVETRRPEIAEPSRKWNTQIAIGLIGLMVIVLAIILLSTFIKRRDGQSLAEITDAQGVRMLLVPAGEFTMGSYADHELKECQKYLSDCQRSWFEDAEPPHQVYLADYYIDKYEITNVLYKVCVDNGICQPPKESYSFTRASYYGNPDFDNYPVIFVDWNMARTYCEWREARLPTEAQWEKAARGTDGRTYPWGEGIDCTKANYYDSIRNQFCFGDTNAVGSYEEGKSPFGIYDMAGSVFEWVADWYSDEYYQNSPSGNPLGPDSGQYRIQRGGSWDRGYTVSSSSRFVASPAVSDNRFGFRCAKDTIP